jgi:predicted ATP-binding protein involved in virulence
LTKLGIGIVMNIERLTIQNFRNIGEPRTFELNPNFTAFIGVNGKGKSTILHALRIAAGSFFLGIPDVKKRHIFRDEIRIETAGTQEVQKYPVKVEVVGKFPGSTQSITWRRRWLEGSSSTTSSGADVGSIRDIGHRKYERITKELNDQVDLPIIAFFGIQRAVGAGRISKISRIQRLGRRIFKEGYQDWESMMATKFHYPEWLGTYDVLRSQEKEYEGTRDAFYAAIKLATPFITQIEFHNSVLWVKTKIDNHESDFLPIALHSDGIHYFIEMVSEIAYRCIVLNGYKKDQAIAETTGIIMIDEIDLHLHPSWQRHVVGDLKKAFPKIQFVVTTHSPFIVQSLKSDEIWNLDKTMDVAPDELKIDTIATEIMGVSSAYSETNQESYQKSKNFLNDLETDKSVDELNKDLEEISDPAIRAFLELRKMSKGK